MKDELESQWLGVGGTERIPGGRNLVCPVQQGDITRPVQCLKADVLRPPRAPYLRGHGVSRRVGKAQTFDLQDVLEVICCSNQDSFDREKECC